MFIPTIRGDSLCWKTHLQNIPDKKNQAAWIPIIIHVIEKCVHLPFVRSFTKSRQEVLRDPLGDGDPLDCTLMTSLIFCTLLDALLSYDYVAMHLRDERGLTINQNL